MQLKKVKRSRVDKRRRKTLEDNLDAAASLYARDRDGWKCRKCGAQKTRYNLHAHHICKRSRLPTRWAPENLVSLCVSCHQWAEDHPDDAREWAAHLLGERDYDRIVRASMGLARFTVEDLEDMLAEFHNGTPRGVMDG